jgi:hypothetical protein
MRVDVVNCCLCWPADPSDGLLSDLQACQHLRDSAIDVVDCRHSGVLLSKQQVGLHLLLIHRYYD